MQASKLILVAALTVGFGLAAASTASARPNKNNRGAAQHHVDAPEVYYDATPNDHHDYRGETRGEHRGHHAQSLTHRQAKKLRRLERRQRKELRRARRHFGPGTWPVRQLRQEHRMEVAQFYARVMRRNARRAYRYNYNYNYNDHQTSYRYNDHQTSYRYSNNTTYGRY